MLDASMTEFRNDTGVHSASFGLVRMLFTTSHANRSLSSALGSAPLMALPYFLSSPMTLPAASCSSVCGRPLCVVVSSCAFVLISSSRAHQPLLLAAPLAPHVA